MPTGLEARLYDGWMAAAAIPFPDPPLGGPQFTLRPFRPADFAAARALDERAGEPGWVEALPEADGAGMAAAFEEHRRQGSLLQLVIADSGNGEYLGEFSLAMVEPGIAELGCAIVPAARRRGIATAALGLVSDWALDTLALRRLQVTVDPRNTPALRLAERAGFQREGLLRAYREADGKDVDAVLLSRIAGDPVPRQPAPGDPSGRPD
jgi:RimJ/RimL family protein N-acetyltransferase